MLLLQLLSTSLIKKGFNNDVIEAIYKLETDYKHTANINTSSQTSNKQLGHTMEHQVEPFVVKGLMLFNC